MTSYISGTWNYLTSFFPSYDPSTLKASLKLASISLNLSKTQKENFIKEKERECITFMRQGKEFEAKLLMENILIEQGKLRCFAILKQLLMLLESRQKMIDEANPDTCPYALKEALSSVIYASKRLSEVKHVDEICEQFKLKFGDEFINTHKENKEMSVNLRVVDALNPDLITGPLVLENLREIAQKYDLVWQPKDFELYAVTTRGGQDAQPRVPMSRGDSDPSSTVYPSMGGSNETSSAPVYPSLDSSTDLQESAPPSRSPSSLYGQVSGGSAYSDAHHQNYVRTSTSYPSTYGSAEAPQAPSSHVNPNYQAASSKSDGLEDSGLSQEDYSDILQRFARLKAGRSESKSPPPKQDNNNPPPPPQVGDVDDTDDTSAAWNEPSPRSGLEDQSLYFQARPQQEEDSSQKVLGKAVALFSYDSTRDDELSAEEGDSFDIVVDPSGQEGDDWVLCRNTTGNTGYLPTNHLRIS